MAVKIKLKRIGKMREPHYRIVVADARTKRGGRAIEQIGQYHPKENPSVITLDSERVQYWLGVGAQPTEAVAAILRVTGDWQAFKGEPAPPPMQVAEAKPDKLVAFEAAAKEAASEPTTPATTPRTKKAKPAEAPKAEAPKAEAPKAEAPKAEAPKAEAPKAEEPTVEAEEPKAEEPTVEAEEPKAEEPAAEQPEAPAADAEPAAAPES